MRHSGCTGVEACGGLAAAVFLFEATVLMAASASWSGAWSQRIYGTGEADVWEIINGKGILSHVAFQQGWRTLELYGDVMKPNPDDKTPVGDYPCSSSGAAYHKHRRCTQVPDC